jgi:hypothetical protein
MAQLVEVLGSYSRAQGLPPVALRLEVSGLIASIVPTPSTYLSLSGPPGGPLFLVVKPLGRGPADMGALENAVRREESREVAFGPRGTVRVGGTPRDAVLYFAGEKSAATAGCAVALPVGEENLLVLFGTQGTARSVTSCEQVASHPSLKRSLESFQADWVGEETEVHPRDAE